MPKKMLTYANCKLKTEFPKPGIEQLTCLTIETLLFTEPPSPSKFEESRSHFIYSVKKAIHINYMFLL